MQLQPVRSAADRAVDSPLKRAREVVEEGRTGLGIDFKRRSMFHDRLLDLQRCVRHLP